MPDYQFKTVNPEKLHGYLQERKVFVHDVLVSQKGAHLLVEEKEYEEESKFKRKQRK